MEQMLCDINKTTQPIRNHRVFNNWDFVSKGWYIVCKSKELKKGKTISKKLCGHQLALFRTESGKACAIDAFCSHMGMDMTKGKVVGETLRCHFHHWKFDGDGKCVEIPCLKHIPQHRMNMNAYPVEEKYGFVWVYSDLIAPEPVFEIEEFKGKEILFTSLKPFRRVAHPVRQAYVWLKNDKNWQGQVYLLFTPGNSEMDVKKVLYQVSQMKNVAQIESPFEIESYLTEKLPPEVTSRVLIDASVGLMKRYRSASGYIRVPIYTNSFELRDLREVEKNIETICGSSCWLAGQTVVYLEYSDRISQSLIESLAGSILSVVLLLVFLAYLRGNRNYFSLVLSSIWSPFVMLGFFWLFKVPVTSVTSIFFALIVGWTGDNAIQYLFASDDLIEGAEERVSASLMQTLIFCGSSLLFIFHSFMPMKVLGASFVLGFFLTYVGDVWILKGLLNLENSIRWPFKKRKT